MANLVTSGGTARPSLGVVSQVIVEVVVEGLDLVGMAADREVMGSGRVHC